MFKKFFEEKNGSLFVEYLILLAVMAFAAALILPSMRELKVKVFNQSIENITTGITGGYSTQPNDFDLDDLPLITPPGTTIYTRTISLDRPTPKNDYQVKVVLNPSNFDYSKAKSDGSDLIFKDLNGNKLPRYIETWNTNGNSIIWVKVKDAGTTKFTVQYDKFQSQSNNPKNVFDLYDDFSNFNSRFWVRSSKTTESLAYTSNGVLNITGGGITTINPLPFDSKQGYYFEVKAKITADNQGNSGTLPSLTENQFNTNGNSAKDATILIMRVRNTFSDKLGVWIGNGDKSSPSNYVYDDDSTSPGKTLPQTVPNDSWNTYGFKVLPNSVEVYMDGQLIKKYGGINWLADLKYLNLGDYRGIKSTSPGFITDEMQYDYILARKASDIEPTATVGVETETIN